MRSGPERLPMTTATVLMTTLLAGTMTERVGADPDPAMGLPGVLAGPFHREDSTYYLLEDATWEDAQRAAETCFDANLVTINDAAESAWLLANVIEFDGAARHAWIGYTDRVTEGDFCWVTGEAAEFEHWLSAEPNGGSFENYGAIFAGQARWFDAQNDWNERIDPVHGIVEVRTIPVAYNERWAGDASNTPGAPTDVGSVAPGVNRITGAVDIRRYFEIPPFPLLPDWVVTGDTDDVFKFDVPARHFVTDLRVIVSGYASTGAGGQVQVTHTSEGITEPNATGDTTLAGMIGTESGALAAGRHQIGLRAQVDTGNLFKLDSSVLADYEIELTVDEACLCDFVLDLTVDVQDLLAYLSLWFPSDPSTELDGNPSILVGDLLVFLACWFPASEGLPCE